MVIRRWPKPLWLPTLLALLRITSALAHDAIPTEPSTQSSVSATTTPESQTHTVQVGLLDHKMRPETTEVAVGDFIEFGFYPLNHSIVRAEYGFPCIPYEMTGSEKTGFFSGFNPVDKVLDKPPKYTIRVNDTEPFFFFYYSAPGSCITYGMVGGINLNSSMSIDK
jgi:plastocyanin